MQPKRQTYMGKRGLGYNLKTAFQFYSPVELGGAPTLAPPAADPGGWGTGGAPKMAAPAGLGGAVKRKAVSGEIRAHSHKIPNYLIYGIWRHV